MSRFLDGKRNGLDPYVPGEQPKGGILIKLNTNESPFPPSERAVKAAEEAARNLQLYSDPECSLIREKLAETYSVGPENVLVTNGSDEALNFAFMAYCSENSPAVFPDITYGFYPVFCRLHSVPYREIPLKDDFTIDPDEYLGSGSMVVIANPNAPTGVELPVKDIEKIIRGNPDNIVLVDEAYVDFGAESCVGLISRYDNLLVVGTFSKSRFLAGARLGFVIGDAGLISDLDRIRNSTNPYNVNSMTMACGAAMLEDADYTNECCRIIKENREYTASKLRELGFCMPDSKANFVFAAHPEISGAEIYGRLRENGILVRHFDKERIRNFNRITIGTMEQMKQLISTLERILER